MLPWDLCTKLVHHCPVRSGGGEGPHVPEVAGRLAGELGEGLLEVGGGLQIHNSVPAYGTVILFERSTSRVNATQLLDEGNGFEFGPSGGGYHEPMFSLFGNSNAPFQLYFVPAKKQAPAPPEVAYAGPSSARLIRGGRRVG